MAKLFSILLLLCGLLAARSLIAEASYGPVSNCPNVADRIACRRQSAGQNTKLTCCTPNPGKPSCVDLLTTPGFCGSCTKFCAKDQICKAGKCVAGALPPPDASSCAAILCLAPSSCCSGTCPDTETDFFNCGQCGNSCAYPPGVEGIPRLCQAGQCVNG